MIDIHSSLVKARYRSFFLNSGINQILPLQLPCCINGLVQDSSIGMLYCATIDVVVMGPNCTNEYWMSRSLLIYTRFHRNLLYKYSFDDESYNGLVLIKKAISRKLFFIMCNMYGLVQDCGILSASAMEIVQPCTKPSSGRRQSLSLKLTTIEYQVYTPLTMLNSLLNLRIRGYKE